MDEIEIVVPPGLGEAGEKWYRRLLSEFDLDTVDLLELAFQAAKTLDTVARLQAAVDDAPALHVTGVRGTLTPLPELQELRQFQRAFAAMVKQLGCESAADVEVREKKAAGEKLSHAERGRLGAQKRWGVRNSVV